MHIGGRKDVIKGPRFLTAVSMSDEESELKKRGYTLGTAIGEGSYAKVKAAYSDKAKARVAVKIINKKKAPRDFREKFLPRELMVIKQVDHENIIKLHEIIEFHNKVSVRKENVFRVLKSTLRN